MPLVSRSKRSSSDGGRIRCTQFPGGAMRTLAFAVAAAAVVLPAASQNTGPLPPLTAQVEVHVVNVDVTVTDAQGKPVLDLTKDDFEVFEDGRLQKLTNFSVIRNTPPTPVATPAASPRAATESLRRILLIVDNNYLEIVERNRALDTIEKYLNDTYSGEWAVAAIGHNVSLLQSFTPDKTLVRNALGKLRRMPTLASQHGMGRSVFSHPQRAAGGFFS